MRVLITGATGMIGSEITRLCREKKIGVNYLTTSRKKIQQEQDYQGFYWNPATGEMDMNSLEGVGVIIHLAGANIFRRWTKNNKKKLMDSRLKSANLLFKALKVREHFVSQFISASGISVYPSSYEKMYYEEEREKDDSFLGKLVVEWEKAADRFKTLDIRVAKIRTGIVLSEKEGALPQMQRPVKYGLGSPLGSGNQWQSWIHIEDLARIYLHVLSHGLEGVFNAVAPNPVTNKELMHEIAASLDKKIRLPNIPAFAMKLVMGEMAEIALSSQLVASKKIEETGFSFHFVNLKKVLEDINQKKGADNSSQLPDN